MSSRLLQLPQELRDQVYRYLIPTVGGCRPLCINDRGRWINLESQENCKIRSILSPDALPILYTCRQVHDEASNLFFKENKFYYLPRANQHIPVSFQEQSFLRANVNQIKHLRLSLHIGRPNPKKEAMLVHNGWLDVGDIATILKVCVSGP